MLAKALAKCLLRHEEELFQFVLVEGLSADNNLAERSIRPLVVIRKISAGSRSAEGGKTRMALASLFETWQARPEPVRPMPHTAEPLGTLLKSLTPNLSNHDWFKISCASNAFLYNRIDSNHRYPQK